MDDWTLASSRLCNTDKWRKAWVRRWLSRPDQRNWKWENRLVMCRSLPLDNPETTARFNFLLLQSSFFAIKLGHCIVGTIFYHLLNTLKTNCWIGKQVKTKLGRMHSRWQKCEFIYYMFNQEKSETSVKTQRVKNNMTSWNETHLNLIQIYRIKKTQNVSITNHQGSYEYQILKF